MSILDDLPELFGDVLGDLVFYDAVLSRDVKAQSGSSYDPDPTTPQNFTCKALDTEWSTGARMGGLVAQADRQILILASTLATVPQMGDSVAISGRPTFRLVEDGGSAPAVSSDPSNSTYTCRGRS